MAALRGKLAQHGEQVEEAYNNGATLREIADVYDTSPGTVRNCLIERGVSLRSRGRKKNSQKLDTRVLPVNDLDDEQE